VTLDGRSTQLRPIGGADYEGLRRIELTTLGASWRYRGATPSPEAFAANLWRGVLTQYMVVGRSDNRALGYVSAYNASLRHGHAYLAAARFSTGSSFRFLEGAALFIDHVFQSWPFRKLYLDVTEFTLPQFEGMIGNLCEIEGRFIDDVYYRGRTWDRLILALYRTRWDDVTASTLSRFKMGVGDG